MKRLELVLLLLAPLAAAAAAAVAEVELWGEALGTTTVTRSGAGGRGSRLRQGRRLTAQTTQPPVLRGAASPTATTPVSAATAATTAGEATGSWEEAGAGAVAEEVAEDTAGEATVGALGLGEEASEKKDAAGEDAAGVGGILKKKEAGTGKAVGAGVEETAAAAAAEEGAPREATMAEAPGDATPAAEPAKAKSASIAVAGEVPSKASENEAGAGAGDNKAGAGAGAGEATEAEAAARGTTSDDALRVATIAEPSGHATPTEPANTKGGPVATEEGDGEVPSPSTSPKPEGRKIGPTRTHPNSLKPHKTPSNAFPTPLSLSYKPKQPPASSTSTRHDVSNPFSARP